MLEKNRIAAGSQIKICDDPVFFNQQQTNFFWDDVERINSKVITLRIPG